MKECSEEKEKTQKNTKSIKVSNFVQISFTFLLQILHAAIFNIEGEKKEEKSH